MGPETRTAVATAAIVFWCFFALLTATVIIDEKSLDITTISAIVILLLLAPLAFSALRGGRR